MISDNRLATMIFQILSNAFIILKKEAERQRTDQSFFVPVAEIKENDYDLSINKYKEIEYEKS